MKKIKLLIILIFSFCFAQWSYIDVDGISRSYYISYPPNLDPENTSIPLVINMHGFGGNASGQISYTQMNQYAHSQGVAVVYPQGLNNSWNVYTYWDNNSYDDVSFINSMIDQIAIDFNIDLDRVYACGMSNGGYMAYRLACDLSEKIAAFGSVTGNFMPTSSQGDCINQNRDIPIIHFHGTFDQIVGYYPPSFDYSLTVGESIDFWSNYNNLSTEYVESLNSNVEIYTYSKESSITKFIHYKVYGGGHEWFNNSWGFHTSQVLINFFLEYRLSDFYDLFGDLNDDEVINILDIVILVQHILNPSNVELDGVDINNDGIINVLDVVQLLNIILG